MKASGVLLINLKSQNYSKIENLFSFSAIFCKIALFGDLLPMKERSSRENPRFQKLTFSLAFVTAVSEARATANINHISVFNCFHKANKHRFMLEIPADLLSKLKLKHSTEEERSCPSNRTNAIRFDGTTRTLGCRLAANTRNQH